MNRILDMVNNVHKSSQKPNTNTGTGIPTSASDPRLSSAVEYANSHGGDPKTVFMQMCAERGINMPNVNTPMEALQFLANKNGESPLGILKNLFGTK